MPVSTKVTAATLAAALSTILIWLLQTYVHLDMPAEVRGAIEVLLVAGLTLATAYLTPEKAPAPSAVKTVRQKGLA